MRSVVVVALLALGHAKAASFCKEAAASLTGDFDLSSVATTYVNAVTRLCSDSMLDFIHANPEVETPNVNYKSSSSPLDSAGQKFMCEFHKDTFTEATTFTFDGCLAEGYDSLVQDYKDACNNVGKFCTITFSGGAKDTGSEMEKLLDEVVLDYTCLAVCIPDDECQNNSEDMAILTEHFLQEGGFFGFDTGVDLADLKGMPFIQCDDGSTYGNFGTVTDESTTEYKPQATAAAAQSSQPTTSSASNGRSIPGLVFTSLSTLVLATALCYSL